MKKPLASGPTRPLAVTVTNAAQQLGCSRQTIYNRMEDGALTKHLGPTGTWHVRNDVLLRKARRRVLVRAAKEKGLP